MIFQIKHCWHAKCLSALMFISTGVAPSQEEENPQRSSTNCFVPEKTVHFLSMSPMLVVCLWRTCSRNTVTTLDQIMNVDAHYWLQPYFNSVTATHHFYEDHVACRVVHTILQILLFGSSDELEGALVVARKVSADNTGEVCSAYPICSQSCNEFQFSWWTQSFAIEYCIAGAVYAFFVHY